ncbi:calcium-binding protein [Marimonas lutisalis]|uniref:calcium-binding protein n=1 Tax=Marimonas lutisalis TaxID=2545756 RepID=UPI0010F49730|nr:calcium-binding protein [Marimonas lutisalis]
MEIEENGSFGGTDQLIFTSYASTDATFSMVAGDPDDLVITLPGGDEVLVRNGLGSSAVDRIEQFVLNGDATTLSAGDLRALLLAQQQTAGDDVFNGRDIAEATWNRLVPGSDDLLVEFVNGDSVLVIGGASNSFNDRIETFTFDDGSLTHTDVFALI